MNTNVQKAVAILREGMSGFIGDESVRITQVTLKEEHRDVKFSISRQRRREDGEWIKDEHPFCFISELLRPCSLDELKVAVLEVFGSDIGVCTVYDNKRLSRKIGG